MTVDWRNTHAGTPVATLASWPRNTSTQTRGMSNLSNVYHILSTYVSSSARPCHTHPGSQCVAPWHGPLVYGLLLPWVTIASGAIMVTLLLCWDYHKTRGLFTHLVDYTSVSHTDNQNQMNTQQIKLR